MKRAANKYSKSMKDQILKIADDLRNGDITTEGANHLLLGLFAAIGMLPDVLRQTDPYPLVDVLERLVWATKYLLHEKSYDGGNYEELEQCVRRADETILMLKGNYH